MSLDDVGEPGTYEAQVAKDLVTPPTATHRSVKLVREDGVQICIREDLATGKIDRYEKYGDEPWNLMAE